MKIIISVALSAIGFVLCAVDANLSNLPQEAKVSRCVINGKDRTNDNTIVITAVPNLINNLQMVSIPYIKPGAPAPAYSITIDCPAVVYILVHDVGKPNIPKEWKKLDIKVELQVNSLKGTDSVYAQYFTAGKVEIPGHDGKEVKNYGLPNAVLIKPDK